MDTGNSLNVTTKQKKELTVGQKQLKMPFFSNNKNRFKTVNASESEAFAVMINDNIIW
jgi:hypothetical protein